jgi:CheY-like chemotaxis protein
MNLCRRGIPVHKHRGTGLGLSIVKKLVELQGGRIEVKSEPGAGTRIRVTIPYHKGDKQNIPVAETGELPIPASFRQLSVLIADDDEFNSYLMNNILTKWGVKFVAVKNGKEAVKASIDGEFDLILMDLHMPEMNGLDAAKIILASIPDARIAAVSATNNKDEQMASKNAGMHPFISKPFGEKELYDILMALQPRELIILIFKKINKLQIKVLRSILKPCSSWQTGITSICRK